jgi:hypothetical protein
MNLLHFERRTEPVAPFGVFAARLLRHAGLAFAVIAGFVVAGAAVYYFFFRPGDSAFMAIHRASMILFGMGPVDGPKSGYERVFIDIYALLSVVLPVIVGMFLAPPVIHRVIHHLHRVNDQDPAATELKP